METLQEYLDEYYHITVISKKDATELKSSLKEKFEEQPEMQKEAKARMNSSIAMSQRCFISRTHAKFLQEVLNG